MKAGLPRILSLAWILLAAGAAAQDPARSAIPDTPLGHRVTEYVTAFNSSDEKAMIGFWMANFTSESLRQRPVEARLQFYRQMRADMKTISLSAVEEATPTVITLRMKAETGGFSRFRFEAQANPPHRLTGMRVESIEPQERRPRTVASARSGPAGARRAARPDAGSAARLVPRSP